MIIYKFYQVWWKSGGVHWTLTKQASLVIFVLSGDLDWTFTGLFQTPMDFYQTPMDFYQTHQTPPDSTRLHQTFTGVH